MLEDLLRNLGIGQTNSGVSCGDGEGATGHSEMHSTNPATGAALPGVRAASPADYERVVRGRPAFPTWRMVPPPRRGEVIRQIGEALRAEKGRPGAAGHSRNGQDPQRGGGRSPGDDRHVRFRRGAVAAALRPDDRQRAAPAPDDRAVAAAGADRHHHGVQLPGRRLGLERDDRRGLRRHDDLEALAATPLAAIAVQKIVDDVAEANGCPGVFNLCIGGADDIGERMLRDDGFR